MYCDRCGTALVANQNFCRACGRPLAGIPAGPAQSRMAGHARLLGILWLAYSGLRLLPGVFLLGFNHWGFHFPLLPSFAMPLMGIFGGFLMIGALLGFVAGWGLLERQPWARTLVLFLGCFALIHPPLGTALGIYTLWVMLPNDGAGEYGRLCGMRMAASR
jgi:hypothetical protein